MAARSASIRMRGVRELQALLGRVEHIDMVAPMLEAADQLRSLIEPEVPVDTGALQGSGRISGETVGDRARLTPAIAMRIAQGYGADNIDTRSKDQVVLRWDDLTYAERINERTGFFENAEDAGAFLAEDAGFRAVQDAIRAQRRASNVRRRDARGRFVKG